LFFAAMGTILARKIHALLSPPYKVVILDCDNTLWKGVVAEDGVDGIAVPPAWKQLQEFLVKLSGQGFLLGLCSKNDEADVLAVFDRRSDMVLKREHLVSWRINWRPKSENMRSIASELNLALESFVFLDDNPLECAEVQAGCPEILTLRLPIEKDMMGFLERVWAFDRVWVTAEDQERTAMYRQEIERARFQRAALSMPEFLAGLELRVGISEPEPGQISRVAQLTQRTNQFNFTTIRRSDGEIQRLSSSGLECRVVEVSDRFGNYGTVGVMIFGVRGDILEVDTFLLSCRVLGRGVEHRMLSALGAIAGQRGISLVEVTLIPTPRNQPARDFLAGVAGQFRQEFADRSRYMIPAEDAAAVTFTPEAFRFPKETVAEPPAIHAGLPARPAGKLRVFERIATELFRPEQVLGAILSQSRRRRDRTAENRSFAAPQSETEAALAEIWAEVLRVEPVGIEDDFFELGGTSLLAVDVFALIERRLERKLPLTALIEAPTVERLARLVDGAGWKRDSLVLIRPGRDKLPVFLVHDGDGEVMLYRNLAFRLKPDHPVYGLQPHSRGDAPIVHTRITEMAAHHVERIRSVQPHGPYLVGGMCAGGVVAFEIARQLQSQGERVAMVALLDAADVEAPLKAWGITRQRASRFAGMFHQDYSASPGRRAVTIVKKALGKIRNLTLYTTRQSLKKLRDEVRLRQFRYYLDRGMRLPRLLERIPVRTVYLFAERSYRPEGRFDGELVLFRASDGTDADEPYVERYDDPLLGWDRRATRGVRVIDVPGGHSSMLQEPTVSVLAEQVQTYLDAALAGEPAAELTLALAGD
jgi:FkbH-like protein